MNLADELRLHATYETVAMPLEQSRIAIAPGVITHPNLKNVPTGPMTSKQLKKSYKERNAGPKMTKAERRAEERALLEQNRLELEREKRLERDKRKRDKKKAEEEAAKAERRKAGIPEKSRFVRPSQNRITGFLALGKRTRVHSDTEDADTSREDSVIGDMRPLKNKRLSTEAGYEDSGYASPQHNMDTALMNIAAPVNEDDISTIDSQENNQERTCPQVASQCKAPSQRKERPKISDDEDELEPVIEQFRSSQLAEAPNFGTIRTQTDDSSSGFVSVRLFTKASQMSQQSLPKPSLPISFAPSQDYFAHFSDNEKEASPTNSNTFMGDHTIMADADADAVSILRSLSVSGSQAQKTPVSVSRAFGRSSAHYDLFGTDSYPKSTGCEDESIDKTYSPMRAQPSGITSPPKAPIFGASLDYDAMFDTQPPPAQRSSPSLNRKMPKKASPKKSRPKISDDEEEVGGDAVGIATAPKPKPPVIDQFEASQDYLSFFATQATPARKSSPRRAKQAPKELLPIRHHRPQISDDEEFDRDFATYEAVVEKTHVEKGKESSTKLQRPPNLVQPVHGTMHGHSGYHVPAEAPCEAPKPKKLEAFELLLLNIEPPSQDYDALLGGTQATVPAKISCTTNTSNGKKAAKPRNHTEDDQFTRTLLAHRVAQEEEKREEKRREVNKQEQKMKDAIAKRIEQRKLNALSVPQPAAKPLVAKTPVTGQVNPAARFDGFFSPDAPHAKPLQKPQPVKTPSPVITKPAANPQHARLKKVLNQDQLAASQDYLSMLGDDDSDLDGDITPDLPVPKITMSPENMAKHKGYNARQSVKVVIGPGAFKHTIRAPPLKASTPAEARKQAINRFKMPLTPTNPAQSRQPLRNIQSVVQNTTKATTQSTLKPQVPVKQAYKLAQKVPAPRARTLEVVRSEPPSATQILEVGDDFEVLSGTQLLREMTEDGSLSRSTTPAPAPPNKGPEKTSTGTMNNLSQHLPWLLAGGGGGGPQRQVLKPVQQSGISPPSFQQQMQKRVSYPPNQSASTGAKRFMPTNVQTTHQQGVKPTLPRSQTAPRFVQPKAKPLANLAPKALPSIEVDDVMDLDFPSNSQVLREIEEDHRERTRSRSLGVAVQMARALPAPVNRPVVQQQSNPQPKSAAREPARVYKSFERSSQLMREMAEEEGEEKAKRAPETPCPAKQKQVPIQEEQTSKAPNQIKPSVEAISFNIASDELESMSQIARELAEEETTSNKTKQSPKLVPTTIIPPPRPAPDQQKSFSFVRTNTNTPPSAKSYKRVTH